MSEGWISTNNLMNGNTPKQYQTQQRSISKKTQLCTMSTTNNKILTESRSKGKILVLGGNGYLGSNVVKRLLLNDYSVTSLSRRGYKDKTDSDSLKIKEYTRTFMDMIGDARNTTLLETILNEGIDDEDNDEYIAVIHCIGILFDSSSGRLRLLNRLASGSGSKTDEISTYDDITRLTAFEAIKATINYAKKNNNNSSINKIPFIFISAAEADWKNKRSGSFIENNLTPRFARRYIQAKRSVEDNLLSSSSLEYIRPIIFRPSLIYSIDKVRSLPAVSAFLIGNRLGLPFVDRPVTVQSLSLAIFNAMEDDTIYGALGFKDIDKLCMK